MGRIRLLKADALTPPPAVEDRRCVQLGLDHALFFPEANSPEMLGAKYGIVRPICEACAGREACRDWAISTGSWDGMFGAMTPEERWAYAHPTVPLSMFRSSTPAPIPADVEDEVVPVAPVRTVDEETLPDDDHQRARNRAAHAAWADDPTLARVEGPSRWSE